MAIQATRLTTLSLMEKGVENKQIDWTAVQRKLSFPSVPPVTQVKRINTRPILHVTLYGEPLQFIDDVIYLVVSSKWTV